MFESVAPESFAPRNRKLFYESLPMSIGAHALIGAVLVVGGIWEVTFPLESPRLHMVYSIAMEPTPPPPPPAPVQAQAAPKQVVKKEAFAAPEEIVAPTIIPDEIPVVEPLQAVEGSVGEGAPGEAVVKGWIGGTEDAGTGTVPIAGPPGVAGGMEGGAGEAPPNTLVVKRHHPLPMAMTPMSMVYPFYPEEARMRGWEDAVAVRYVIGKDGRVKSVEVLEAPERKIFQKEVVNAIRHWRFRPLMKAGVPQEVIHELVIYFKLTT
jgi:TonB family protein